MNTFFLLNNLHFAIEVFGALAFLVVAWFTFDTYLFRRDFLTAAKAFGFSLLSVWQIMHSFGSTDVVWGYAGFSVYLLGLFSIALSLLLEHPTSRPELKAILILPPLTAVALYVHTVALLLYALIAFLAFRQYKVEFKTALKPFWIGFVALASGAFFAVFSSQDSFGLLWVSGHLFETIGFGALMVWVWQYLKLRVHEEMILIFTSSALLISIIVTFAFSIILVSQVETATKTNLLTNAKVFDMVISGLTEEALAKTKFLSRAAGFGELLAARDLAALEAEASGYLESEKLGFLTIVDGNGEVVLRAHALAQKEDNLLEEEAVATALAGEDVVTIGSSSAEGFSVRAASPLYSGGKENRIIGVVVAGFSLDNALADNIKKITGLEVSIWEGDSIVATTLLNPDGRTRGTGSTLVDEAVRASVLERGEETVVRTEVLSRPALASYLPIKDASGEIVGMISSVKPQQEILALANATNRLTLATVGVLMLILALPTYLITRRLIRE